jgi:hypothetical protein
LLLIVKEGFAMRRELALAFVPADDQGDNRKARS